MRHLGLSPIVSLYHQEQIQLSATWAIILGAEEHGKRTHFHNISRTYLT